MMVVRFMSASIHSTETVSDGYIRAKRVEQAPWATNRASHLLKASA
jgi:hypothetical protein